MNSESNCPEPREHFIPVRKADLLGALTDRLSPPHASSFRLLMKLLDSTFHYNFHQQLEELKDTYAVFDPDRDTRPPGELVESRSVLATTFVRNAGRLLTKANFERLDRTHIEEALEATSDWGLNLQVDFDIFDELEVYARGDVVGKRSRRRWLNAYRLEQIEVPVYQRLVIVFRLHTKHRLQHADPDCIYLKLFKNIPKIDLEMLLPGTQVKMTRLDKGKILLPTISGVAITIFKLVKSIALLATATMSGVFAFLLLIGGTIGYGVKSFFGYLRTRDKYQLNLTRNLYYQNLDNNAGVLHRILDEAEEQEVREAALAYFLLWQSAPAEGWTEAELDAAAEAYLDDEWNLRVDFEADDALDKLLTLGIVSATRPDRHADTRYQAVPVSAATRILDQAWDQLFDPPAEPFLRRAA